MASAVVLKNGELFRNLASVASVGRIQLNPGEVLSWREGFYSAGSGFDWRSRMIHRGDATAYMVCTHGAKSQVDHVDVRIEGSPADVAVLVEEVVELVGGKVAQLHPAKSFFQRIKDWWTEGRVELSH